MIKKVFASALCIGLFAACGGEETPENVGDTSNPEATYTQLMEENNMAWREVLLETMPVVESPEKSEHTFEVSLEANIPEVGGNLTIAFDATSEVDASQSENPRISSALNLDGKLTGAFAGEVKANIEMLVLDAMVYARLKDINLNIPQFATSEIMAPIMPLLGKWYGDSFTTINEALGDDFDIQQMFSENAQGVEKIRNEIVDILTTRNELSYKEMLPAENGMTRFAVDVDTDVVFAKFIRFAEIGQPLPEDEKKEMKEEFDEEMADSTFEGIISFSQENAKYFVFDLIATDASGEKTTITTSVLEDKKSISLLALDGEHISMNITHEGEKDMFELKGGESAEKSTVIFSGTKTEDEFMMDIFNEDGEKEGNLAFVKSGDKWGGNIILTDEVVGDITISITDLVADEKELSYSFSITQGDIERGKGTLSYTIDDISNVDIEAPEAHSPFGELMEQFIPTMSMASPGFSEHGAVPMDDTPDYGNYEMSQEEVEEMLKELEGMEIEGIDMAAELEKVAQ